MNKRLSDRLPRSVRALMRRSAALLRRTSSFSKVDLASQNRLAPTVEQLSRLGDPQQVTEFALTLDGESAATVLLTCSLAGDGPTQKDGCLVVPYFYKGAEFIEHTPYAGWASSNNFRNYRYLPVSGNKGNVETVLSLTVPRGVNFVIFRILKWKAKGPVTVESLTFSTQMAADGAQAALHQGTKLGAHVNEPLAAAKQKAHQANLRGDLQQVVGHLEPFSLDPSVQQTIRYTKSKLQILETNWLPLITGPNSARSSNGELTVCHLMKVALPYENSGGAVRNFQTVDSQATAGLNPYVITPLNYPSSSFGADGIHQRRIGRALYFHILARTLASRLPESELLQIETTHIAAIFSVMGASVVHAHSGYKGFDNALKGLAVARHFKRPFVYDVRSFHEHTWSSPFPGIENSPHTQKRMMQENRCMAEADAVVVIASAMKDNLIERGISPEKISVIPNAVDDDWFSGGVKPSGSAVAFRERFGSRKIVGYISNMSAREGHKILVDALGILRARGHDVGGLFVGDGPLRTELEEYAEEAGLRPYVEFTGNVAHNEIQSFYDLIDVFVVPRIADYASDFVTPLKPFEALARKRPLIMSDRPVSSEIVGDDGDRGLLFETGNPDDLANKIENVLRFPDRSSAMAERGYDWVRENRRWSRNGEDYRTLYESVIERFSANN